MECVYLINWYAWLPRIRDCCPVAVEKPGDEEEAGEEEVNREESEEEIEMVRGADSKKKATPMKKRPTITDNGDNEDKAPKKQQKTLRTKNPSAHSIPRWR